MENTSINSKVGAVLTADMINRAAADVWGVPVENLFIKTRKREIVEPRQIIQYYRYVVQLESPGKVAADTNAATHATVCHSGKVIEGLLQFDKRLQANYNRFVEKLKTIDEV